ncbi:MAG: hypothetical protein RRY29_05195 [Desulfovibrionaceae bacterium]
MPKFCLGMVCLLLLFGLAWGGARVFASGPTAGSYTWASFSYSWNKNTPPKLQLNNPIETPQGYTIDYGYTTTLDIFIENSAVQGTCVHFVGGGENDAGGRTFTQLMKKSLEVGSYRWPSEQISEAREAFKIIGKTHKEYSYNITQFTFDYTPVAGWAFCMRYLPPQSKDSGH